MVAAAGVCMKTSVVSGANGFLGSLLVRRLLKEEDHRVVALVGPDCQVDHMRELDVEIREFDLTRPEEFDWVLEGGDYLYHMAANYSFWQKDPAAIYELNVRGTQRLLEAAGRLNYEKIVYTSSATTLSPSLFEPIGDEEQFFDPRQYLGPYKTSKYLAEQAVLRLAALGLPVTIVQPTAPVGEGDRRPTPTGEMILMFVQHKMVAYVPANVNIVSAEDVVEGHFLAMQHGELGDRYILGGDNLTMVDIFRILSEYTGIPEPRIKLPSAPLLAAAKINEWVSDNITHRPPTVALEAVLLTRHSNHFSSDKAKRELFYKPRPAKLAIEQAAQWFIDEGYAQRTSPMEFLQAGLKSLRSRVRL